MGNERPFSSAPKGTAVRGTVVLRHNSHSTAIRYLGNFKETPRLSPSFNSSLLFGSYLWTGAGCPPGRGDPAWFFVPFGTVSLGSLSRDPGDPFPVLPLAPFLRKEKHRGTSEGGAWVFPP